MVGRSRGGGEMEEVTDSKRLFDTHFKSFIVARKFYTSHSRWLWQLLESKLLLSRFLSPTPPPFLSHSCAHTDTINCFISVIFLLQLILTFFFSVRLFLYRSVVVAARLLLVIIMGKCSTGEREREKIKYFTTHDEIYQDVNESGSVGGWPHSKKLVRLNRPRQIEISSFKNKFSQQFIHDIARHSWFPFDCLSSADSLPVSLSFACFSSSPTTTQLSNSSSFFALF